ncbi:putative [histone H3]-lysine(4) N-trimethyltransferase chromatin regulator PHD family [Dioscorea sansibarensis]
MAPIDLPCDIDGVCMVCKKLASELEIIPCRTCATPWHAPCLSRPPGSVLSAWLCPDCSASPVDLSRPAAAAAAAAAQLIGASGGGLVASIRAIEADGSLTEQEKARRRQALVGGGVRMGEDSEEVENGGNGALDLLDEKFNCSFCMQLLDRPVTTPCGHNFCLKCFQKWIGQGKRTCAKCRSPIPSKMASQPRVNSALVVAIRVARTAKPAASNSQLKVYHFIRNENRPDKAFTTERAKKAGKANACSGQIFVTVPPDHFGPILAEHDPKRNRGVLVGDLWEDRLECRQWGAHLPHIAGIAGQSDYGAQSVALSGGYEDDEDHGDWFLYTGSGGRDLSGNKRTNKEHAFDQKFEKYNEALRVSCKKGFPVRVVRSHKEKRSAYAPESGVRYDGIYRIEKCWRKVGSQGFKVCRYLFVRCDTEPAPWTSDEKGDRPRPLPAIKELKHATDMTVRKERPAWDYDEGHGWRWTRSAPQSRKAIITGDSGEKRKGRSPANKASKMKRVARELSCEICWKLMSFPLTTPCAHNFCKSCLLGSYTDQSFVRERSREGGRTLRTQKIVKKCPSCPSDISDFLQNPQVNRELMDLIDSIDMKSNEENAGSSEEGSDVLDKSEDGKVSDESAPNNDETNATDKEINQMDGTALNEITSHDGDSLVNAVNYKIKDAEEENLSMIGRITRSCKKRKTNAEKENPITIGRVTRAAKKRKTNTEEENLSTARRTTRASTKLKQAENEKLSTPARITRTSIKRNANAVQN